MPCHWCRGAPDAKCGVCFPRPPPRAEMPAAIARLKSMATDPHYTAEDHDHFLQRAEQLEAEMLAEA